MKVVVIGAGRMGKAAAYDLVRNPRVCAEATVF